MTSPSSYESNDDIAITDRRSPAWGAILGGAVAGLAVHILLMMLLTAIGLGAANPETADNPVATFSLGTALAWTLSALVSLFVGGWVAGRCSARVHSVSGAVHGFLVWCVATISAVLLVAFGAGALIGGTARIVGEGLSALGKPVSGAADLAKQMVEQNGSAVSSMIDEVADNPQVRNSAGGVAAARREIGIAVRQLFREGGNLQDPDARNATVQALTRAGIAQADANRMVDSWISSMQQMHTQMDQMKQEATARARQAADQASGAIAKGAFWGFIGFVFGAVAATLGGRRGQRWEYQHTEIGADASLDPSTRHMRSDASLPGHA